MLFFWNALSIAVKSCSYVPSEDYDYVSKTEFARLDFLSIDGQNVRVIPSVGRGGEGELWKILLLERSL